jgi:hypothetical protein
LLASFFLSSFLRVQGSRVCLINPQDSAKKSRGHIRAHGWLSAELTDATMRYPCQVWRHPRKSPDIVECIAGAVKSECIQYTPWRYGGMPNNMQCIWSTTNVLSILTAMFFFRWARAPMEALGRVDRRSVEPNGSGVLLRLDCHITRAEFGCLSTVGHSGRIH